MTKTTDGATVPVHGGEFAMIQSCKRGDIVEKHLGVEGWFRIKIAENDHGLLRSIRLGKKIPQGMPEPGSQRVLPVTDHQNDVGMDPSHDMGPTDSVMPQDIIIEILDGTRGMRCHCVQRCLEPFPG